jgi:hypothetical protein
MTGSVLNRLATVSLFAALLLPARAVVAQTTVGVGAVPQAGEYFRRGLQPAGLDPVAVRNQTGTGLTWDFSALPTNALRPLERVVWQAASPVGGVQATHSADLPLLPLREYIRERLSVQAQAIFPGNVLLNAVSDGLYYGGFNIPFDYPAIPFQASGGAGTINLNKPLTVEVRNAATNALAEELVVPFDLTPAAVNPGTAASDATYRQEFDGVFNPTGSQDGIRFRRVYRKQVFVDGYGTLQLPGGLTVQEVYRIRTRTDEHLTTELYDNIQIQPGDPVKEVLDDRQFVLETYTFITADNFEVLTLAAERGLNESDAEFEFYYGRGLADATYRPGFRIGAITRTQTGQAISGNNLNEGDGDYTVEVLLDFPDALAGATVVANLVASGTNPAAVGTDVLFAAAPQAVSQTLSFGAGAPSQTFTITVTDNFLRSANKTFQVRLTNPSTGYFLNMPDSVELTILDNDRPLLVLGNNTGQVDFLVSEREAGQTANSTRTVNLPLRILNNAGIAPGQTVTARLRYVDATAREQGTGIPGYDYTITTQTVALDLAQSEANFTVAIRDNDLGDGNRFFKVYLELDAANAAVAAVGYPDSMRVFIIDDEKFRFNVQFAGNLQAVSVNENTAELGNVLVLPLATTVPLRWPMQQLLGDSITVRVRTVALADTVGRTAAVAGQDYLAIDTLATFFAGDSLVYVAVPILNNTLAQGARVFAVELSEPAPATAVQLGSFNRVVVTILDNDLISTGLTESTVLNCQVYPNPTRGVLNFTGLIGGAEATVELTDLTGRAVLPALRTWVQSGDQLLSMDLGQLPAGVYSARVRQGGLQAVLKVVKL